MKPERLVLGEQDQVHSFVPQARRHAEENSKMLCLH